MSILQGEVEEVEEVFKEKEGIEMISDLVILILLRLPVKSLLRFKCLSKYWNNFITSPEFVKMHLKHTHTQNNNPIILLRSCSFKTLYALTYTGSASSPHIESKQIDYPYQSLHSNFQIWGSCNGLLLIYITANACGLLLFNPSMKKFTNLPYYDYYDEIFVVATSDDDRMLTYGFGYNHTMDEYKVIRLLAINTIDKGFVSRVTSFNGQFWNHIRPLPFAWPSQVLRPGLHVDGALLWMVNMSSERQTPCYKIFSFDTLHEDYIDVPKPPYIDTTPEPHLCVLRGCLSILINNDEPKVRVDVWMMMNYGVGESWTKLITITQSSFSIFPRVLWLCKNGEVITDIPCGDAYVYDPESKEAMSISKCALYFHTVGIYAESLVPTDSIGLSGRGGAPSYRNEMRDHLTMVLDALKIDHPVFADTDVE